MTDGIFGYSMLYPYSDNYLDDPRVTRQHKQDFQSNFRRWLSGFHDVVPASAQEKKVHDMVCG